MLIQSIVLIILVFLVLLGIFLVPLALPGTWVIVVSVLIYSFLYPLKSGSAWTLNLGLFGLALFGELMEFGVSTLGCKPFRVSTGAIVTAFIGGIVGAIVGVPVFLVGSILGLFLGAFLGAFIYELFLLKSVGKAFVNACAVLATRLVASVLKTLLAIGMAVYLAFFLF